MNRTQALSQRIDDAFSSLLMAKDILDQVIPNSDCDSAISMANEFAQQLIDKATSSLMLDSDPADQHNIVDFGRVKAALLS